MSAGVKARQIATIEEVLFCECGGQMVFNGHESAGTFVHVCDESDCSAIKYVEGQIFPRTQQVPVTEWAEVPEATAALNG